MKYLLDTVVWFRSVSSIETINHTARSILEDGSNEIYLSAVTAVEVSIKMRLGKLHLPSPPGQCIPAFMAKQGLLPLAITHPHATKVYDFPPHHNDPFDRLLIAQAVLENLSILTTDRIFEKYPVDVIWSGV